MTFFYMGYETKASKVSFGEVYSYQVAKLKGGVVNRTWGGGRCGFWTMNKNQTMRL